MKVIPFSSILEFIRTLYPAESPIPLHAPRFLGNEKAYLSECIDTTYVSYVGRFVTDFEEHIKRLTGARNAIAIVNGTAAIHMVLKAMGVGVGDLVITQALTFAATAAAICHAGAKPAFVDVDKNTMGMSPASLKEYLQFHTKRLGGELIDISTNLRIAAIVPMHTFGHPASIKEIMKLAEEFNVDVVEDAAESIGSRVDGVHTGRFGRAAILSFNGNKPVTTGGGGMIITDDDDLAERVRYISTTAKRKHKWEFFHDEIGYNMRLPNVNAAIGCAQMEYFEQTLQNKRETAEQYSEFFMDSDISFVNEPNGAMSNYWLNSILLGSKEARDSFLVYSNENGVQTRPVWTLMTKLPPYKECPRVGTPVAEWLEAHLVNIPSSVRSWAWKS